VLVDVKVAVATVVSGFRHGSSAGQPMGELKKFNHRVCGSGSLSEATANSSGTE